MALAVSWAFDEDIAGGDAAVPLLQARDLALNALADKVGWLHPLEGNVEGGLHAPR
jgi:hypothetical protein